MKILKGKKIIIPLPKVAFCGKTEFNRKKRQHFKTCPVCIKALNDIKNRILSEWNKQCECGCGQQTSYGNRFYSFSCISKTFRSKKWSEQQRQRQKQSWQGSRMINHKKRMSDNNPMYNEDTKNKVKNTCLKKYGVENPFQQTSKLKQTFIDHYGVDNPSKSTIIKNKISKSYTKSRKQKHSKMMKENAISKSGAFDETVVKRRIETLCDNIANGKIKFTNGFKTGYFIKKNGEKEWYDSSYELTRMIQLENENHTWTKKHGIKIAYINVKNVETYYVPDFLIDDIIIEEIKGWQRPNCELKAKAAIEYCKLNDMKYYYKLGKNMKLIDSLSLI